MELELFCECNGANCTEMIKMTSDEYMLVTGGYEGTKVIISRDCPYGPEPNETFVEHRDGYDVWQMGD